MSASRRPARTVHPQTAALHGGSYRADPATGAVALPIYQTTSYQFHDTGHAERLFALQEVGYSYTRTGNPTRDYAEQRLAALEGGAGALIVATGQAARLYSLLNLAAAGDNVVVAANLAGGATLRRHLARYRIEVRSADGPEAFRRATDDATRAYFAETLSPKDLTLFPIAEVAAVAAEIGLPLIVDNSALPVAVRPLDLGAAIVVYDGAASLGGHGVAGPGVLIDGGKFPWVAHAARFASITAPDESYHGEIWTEVAARFKVPLAYLMKARMRLLRDFGAVVSPMDVFTLLQGVETVALRIAAQADNARRVADFLRSQGETVIYPGQGELVGVALGGDRARRFLDALALIAVSEGYGQIRSSATLTELAGTVAVRLSVGIEHADDIEADLGRALARTKG